MFLLPIALAALQDPLAFEPELAPGAGLTQPVGITSLAGDDRLFVTELPGTVRIVRNGAVDADPFLDIGSEVAASGLAGLRAIAFDPNYDVNGHIFLWYDAPSATNGVDIALGRITRAAADDDATDPASFVELLRAPQDNRGHGGGHIQFGPDGMLYAAFGDGAALSGANCRAQDRTNLMGSVLRLDVSGAQGYVIPSDNPFVGDVALRGEIAHYGLRHPWKWSFDRVTGDMWLTDVGEFDREEVNFIRSGGLGRNFGWSVQEGTTCFASTVCTPPAQACGDGGYTDPIFEYDHGLGCSITGGFVYRGSDIPDLFGAYICADFCSKRFWSLRYDGAALLESVERPVEYRAGAAEPPTPVAFGEDGSGEILLLDHATGAILRLVRPCGAVTSCPGLPNVTGRSASLRALGAPSITDNEFGFRISGLPPLSPTSLFYGPAPASVPIGNGELCVGGGTVGLFRLGLKPAGAAGMLEIPLDFTIAPLGSGAGKVEAGSTWYFQAWYRDVGGPLGGSSNLSSAAAVLFCD